MEEEEKENQAQYSSQLASGRANVEQHSDMENETDLSYLEHESAEFSSSEEEEDRDEGSEPVSLNVTPELLADILHQKQMKILQTPEVMHFLQEHQTMLARNGSQCQSTASHGQNRPLVKDAGLSSALANFSTDSSTQHSLPNR
ncbi:uncharacterized protein LOC101845421 isoform X1 [Aplysia californica]|uniref:Uncharacterized protein LOC101845421 isoform X1 n=1 Tax=Aplysia californica TaxID=6500 RepID=A0ABM0K223_APLCA|nr:uncharacterized protein LOC101845421 isoform X1 [Aplysia californica]